MMGKLSHSDIGLLARIGEGETKLPSNHVIRLVLFGFVEEGPGGTRLTALGRKAMTSDVVGPEVAPTPDRRSDAAPTRRYLSRKLPV